MFATACSALYLRLLAGEFGSIYNGFIDVYLAVIHTHAYTVYTYFFVSWPVPDKFAMLVGAVICTH